MKTRLIILPLLLGNLLLTSCNGNSDGRRIDNPYKYKPEWMNHPHEVLRYPEKVITKVKVSGHKRYSFDENLTVRDAIFSIPYESYLKQDTEIVKTKKYVTYTVYYGYEIDDKLAEMSFFDNGKIFIKDCYDYEYYYSLDATSMRIIFEAAEKDMVAVEAKEGSAKQAANDDCRIENFVNNCIKANDACKDEKDLTTCTGTSYDEKTHKTEYLSYTVRDKNSLIAKDMKKIKCKNRRTETVKEIKNGNVIIRYDFERGVYYSFISNMNQKYYIHFVKRFGDYSNGKTAFFHAYCEISDDQYHSFYSYVRMKISEVFSEATK